MKIHVFFLFEFLLVFALLSATIFLEVCTAHDFIRSFRLKKNETQRVGYGRFIKAIRKLTKIDPIPEIPEVSTIAARQTIGSLAEDAFSYDSCKVTDLCLNGGTCVSHQNDYFCNCPSTHYGKTCEFKADQSKCSGNFCLNNATCYSVEDRRMIPNLDMLHMSSKNLTISVNYECWCKYGFYGSICEFSELMRHCAEDKCNHHGIISPSFTLENNTSDCQCQCEEHYFGEECEMISPCRDLNCVNNSTCVFDKLETTAYCKCPSEEIHLLPAVVKGQECEIVEIPDDYAMNDCVPCQGNFSRYLECLATSAPLEKYQLHYWFGECDDPEAHCWIYDQDLEAKDCFNDGICEVAVGSLPVAKKHVHYGKLFVIPKCVCPSGYEGNFCEKAINECIEEEIDENGVVLKKCIHGQCVFNPDENGIKCICDEGYRGFRCEHKDPCVPNPCGDAVCVEFPVSETFGDTDLKHTCICKTSQAIDQEHRCKSEHFAVCNHDDGRPRCENDGDCYPCSMDTVKALALCNEAEQRRGFRCICASGFLPPFCRANVTACDSHYCLNDALCVTVNGSSIDYKCICRPGFEGNFCHIYLGICKEIGDKTCVKGKCAPNDIVRRGFVCDCDAEHYGLNCERKREITFSSFVESNFQWTWPFFAFVLICLIALLVAICRYPEGKSSILIKP